MIAVSTGNLGMLVRVIFRKGVSPELFATKTNEGTAVLGLEGPGRKVIEENPGVASLLRITDPLFAATVPVTTRSPVIVVESRKTGPAPAGPPAPLTPAYTPPTTDILIL